MIALCGTDPRFRPTKEKEPAGSPGRKASRGNMTFCSTDPFTTPSCSDGRPKKLGLGRFLRSKPFMNLHCARPRTGALVEDPLDGYFLVSPGSASVLPNCRIPERLDRYKSTGTHGTGCRNLIPEDRKSTRLNSSHLG